MIPGIVAGGASVAAGGGGGIDPNLVVLLNMPGADGSTTITDTAVPSRVWTPHGAAQIDTSLGYNTLQLRGAGSVDYITAANDIAGSSFGTGDYCIDAWVYIQSYGALFPIYDTLPVGGFGARNSSVIMYVSNVGSLHLWTRAAVRCASSGTVPLNTLTHVRTSRQGSTLRNFINGVKDGETALSPTDDKLGGLTIGVLADNLGSSAHGHIKAIRAWRGDARETSNFTPDPAPFPTS